MDTRKSLKKNTVLVCGEAWSFVIRDEIARGGSCIVYDAVYSTAGEEKPVRLKECYPFDLEIHRMETGELGVAPECEAAFEKAKSSIRRAFHEGNSLFLAKGLTNTMSNMLHLFEQNNTVYIPSVYLEGETLDPQMFSCLKECVSIVRTVALVLGKIHKAGYLYLDLKPGNVFVLTDAEGKWATELVQLFDFDSLVEEEQLRQNNLDTLRLSYTQGFAALEHQMGQVSRMGFHTDVYSVGAVLFYLIFGIPPKAADCEEGSVYDFEKSRYGDTRYQDRLFRKLTEFFHRTLANYRFDRYQTMEETVETLTELVRLSDQTVPYVFSTTVTPGKCFVGREQELQKIREWAFQGKSRCMFLTGMGGIGKSSLARTFLSREEAKFDTVLYLYYHDSIQSLIADDEALQINTIEKRIEESTEDYFKRKLRSLKKLFAGKQAILVIDNFYGEITEDFLKVLDVGWKVLMLSRETPPSDYYEHLSLGAIPEIRDLYFLFGQYAGINIREDETVYLEHLIEAVRGNTLVLELIARQIRTSRLTLAEVEKQMGVYGFFRSASEKIRFEKDQRTKLESIRNIIAAIFAYHDEDLEKKRILKALSLVGDPGIPIQTFMEMRRLKSQDTLNALEEEGWLYILGTEISMHPVIREAVATWEWANIYQKDAESMMEYLFIQLKLETDREEYPLPFLRNNEYLKGVFGKDTFTGCWLKKRMEKKELPGKMLEKRIQQGDMQGKANVSRMRELLRLSENILESCEAEESFQKTEIWKELQALVLLCMPIDRELYIIQHTNDLLKDSFCKIGDMWMRLSKKLLSIYLEQYEMGEAEILLEKVRHRIRGHNHFIKAEYYDMRAEYLDVCLNGEYWSEHGDHNSRELRKAIDKSIFHMSLAKGVRNKLLLIEYTLGKANVLIRSMPEKQKEIKRLLGQTGESIKENTQVFSKLRWEYMMSMAWYYTLVDPDKERVGYLCQCAGALVRKADVTELEYIDMIIIPYANMMAEFGNTEKAKEILLEGIQICERNPEMIPYARKKSDLQEYLQEILAYALEEQML